jgi:hypothetical protein
MATYKIRGGGGISGGLSSGERIIILSSGGRWRLVAANGIGCGGGISGSRIAAMLAATAPPGGWGDGGGVIEK